MTRRFTAQHTASGFSAMGNHPARPRSASRTTSVAGSIARARRAHANMMKIGSKKAK